MAVITLQSRSKCIQGIHIEENMHERSMEKNGGDQAPVLMSVSDVMADPGTPKQGLGRPD